VSRCRIRNISGECFALHYEGLVFEFGKFELSKKIRMGTDLIYIYKAIVKESNMDELMLKRRGLEIVSESHV
jgi:hypothetical protein